LAALDGKAPRLQRGDRLEHGKQGIAAIADAAVEAGDEPIDDRILFGGRFAAAEFDGRWNVASIQRRVLGRRFAFGGRFARGRGFIWRCIARWRSVTFGRAVFVGRCVVRRPFRFGGRWIVGWWGRARGADDETRQDRDASGESADECDDSLTAHSGP
jgi:hypothetical protein